jgi:hypothetical protein
MPSQDGWFKKGQHGPRYGTGELFREKTCEICSSKFFHIFQRKRTCSKKCELILRHKKNSKITRICPICRKEFQVWPAWVRKGEGIYCSVKCHFGDKHKYTMEQKKEAGNKVNSAIKFGHLIRQPCIICGEPNANAHHHKGYSEEHQLDIVWLCDLHHNQEHERLRRYGLVHLL